MDSMELLKRPFPEDKIHWRVGSTNAKKLNCKPWEATKGSALAYVDARDVMQRLDEVIGTENWQCRYPLADSGLLICEIGIRWICFDEKADVDRWIWKANGAGDTQVEAEKGKCSDAFKRAAVLWGVARYLYYLPFSWVDLENGRLKYNPPLPKWATPEGWDMLTADKEAKDAGHGNVKSEREPQPPVTDKQRELLNKHLDAFKLNPAAIREAKQLQKYLDSNSFTEAHAREILRKFKENGA